MALVNNNTTSTLFINKRKWILDQLKWIRIEEFGKEGGVGFRHVKMTREEAQQQKFHCFKVLFGDVAEEKKIGFCYDFRHLVSEKHFKMDEDEYSLPIVLAPEVWNSLVKKTKDHQMEVKLVQVSTKRGILNFPLSKDEFVSINTQYSGKDKLFVFFENPNETETRTHSNFKTNLGIVYYFDESPEARMYPSNTETKNLNPPLNENDSYVTEQLDFVLNRLKQDIPEFLGKSFNLDEFLKNADLLASLKTRIRGGSTPQMTFGYGFETAISKFNKEKQQNSSKKLAKKVSFPVIEEDKSQ